MKVAIILMGVVFVIGGVAALSRPGPVQFTTGRSADATELSAEQKQIVGVVSFSLGCVVMFLGLRRRSR